MPGTSPLRLFAHRGVSARYPENTLPAFAAAREEGCTAIELDVQLTRDGELVVFHDDDLRRLAGVEGSIALQTLAELGQLDVGVWKSPVFAGTRIPTLAEACDAWAGAGLVNIELKTTGSGNPALAEGVAAFLRGRAVQAVVSSFDWPLLAAYRGLDAATPLGVLFDDDAWQTAAAFARSIGASALNAWRARTTQDAVAFARDAGFEVNVYTVNDPAEARRLHTWGVTGIFTDDAPAMALALQRGGA